jgi:hypothetical protein
LLEVKRDDDDVVVTAVVAAGVAPMDIGAIVLVPNGVAVDEPAPNVKEEVVLVGAGALAVADVEPNPNVEG